MYERLQEILQVAFSPTIAIPPPEGGLQNVYLFFLSRRRRSYSSTGIFTAAAKQVARGRALLFTVQGKGQGKAELGSRPVILATGRRRE